jgi:hypothetical protein
MRLNISESRILAIIFKSGKSIDAFTVYRRLKLSFGEYDKSTRSLVDKGLVHEKEQSLNITLEGKKFLLTQKNNYLINNIKEWRNIPNEYTQGSIQANELYIPKRSLLDSRHFVDI